MTNEKKYIDADLLLNCPIKIEGHFDLTNGKAQNFVAIPVAEIENAPAADVAEVRHGHWLGKTKKFSWWTCSICKSEYLFKPNYCPNCGAIMDGNK